MNITQIKVDYPTMEKQVVKTLAEAKAMGYKSEIAKNVPVNRIQVIRVRKTERAIKEMFMNYEDHAAEMTAKCLEQTGMTPSAYQAKFKRAWND